MLTNLTIENFKAFQKLDNLKIKPITIVCGTNSSGKSSILQSLLLLKQTLEGKTPGQTLLLNGRFVRLGYFGDLLFRKQIQREMSFAFRFVIKPHNKTLEQEKQTLLWYSLLRRFFTNQAIPTHHEYLIEYDLSFKAANGVHNDLERQTTRSSNVGSMTIRVFSPQTPDKKSTLYLKHIKEDKYLLEWKNLKGRNFNQSSENGEMEVKVLFENLLPNIFNFKEQEEKQIGIDLFGLNQILYGVKNFLQNIISPYSYIGPLRQSHQEGGGTYFGDDIAEIGNSGENAPFLYLKDKNKVLKNHFFYDKTNDAFVSEASISIEEALDKCFTMMGVEGFGGSENKRIINLYLNANKFDNTPIDISQVGFGISQMFPIVLEGLRMETGGTLLLEQPEIHLHPNLQMQMADYFIALALSGKNVMAETHSDHVINRLVRRIVEDETHNLKDLIGIYFVKPSENGAVCEPIEIDETKGIVNWPDGFFDQNANEQMRIMQAGLKKRKNQRNTVKN